MYTAGDFYVNGLFMLTVGLHSPEYVNTVLIDQKTKFTVFYCKVLFGGTAYCYLRLTVYIVNSTYQSRNQLLTDIAIFNH